MNRIVGIHHLHDESLDEWLLHLHKLDNKRCCDCSFVLSYSYVSDMVPSVYFSSFKKSFFIL